MMIGKVIIIGSIDTSILRFHLDIKHTDHKVVGFYQLRVEFRENGISVCRVSSYIEAE